MFGCTTLTFTSWLPVPILPFSCPHPAYFLSKPPSQPTLNRLVTHSTVFLLTPNVRLHIVLERLSHRDTLLAFPILPTSCPPPSYFLSTPPPNQPFTDWLHTVQLCCLVTYCTAFQWLSHPETGTRLVVTSCLVQRGGVGCLFCITGPPHLLGYMGGAGWPCTLRIQKSQCN